METRQNNALSMLLAPGNHTFTSLTNNLTFTYVVRGDRPVSDSDSDAAVTSSINRLIIVQCPGWGLGSSYLQEGLLPLERNFSLLYFHPRGTCGSERPKNESEMDSLTMAEDIEGLRLHLSLEVIPAILGHSNGGTISLGYAEKFPERVGKLILLDHRVLGLELEPSGQAAQEEKDDDEGSAEDEEVPSGSMAIDREFTNAWVNVLPRYFFDPATSLPKFRSAMGDNLIDSWCLAKQKKYDQRPAIGRWMLAHLADVRSKILLIFGKQDVVCSLANAERTMRNIEGTEAILLDDCGHFPWIEKEEETLDGITRFLQAPK